jgi:CRISPR-associated protein Cmr3
MNTATATTTIGLQLDPLDVLFFRDARPFGTERSVSGLPLPQTMAGAIRTALLRLADCDFRGLVDAIRNGATFVDAVQQSCPNGYRWIAQTSVRGPWLARRGADADNFDVLVPAPATLHRDKRRPKRIFRLAPLPDGQLPGWNPPSDQNGLRPLWLKCLAATEPVSGYVTPRGLEMFLQGAEIEVENIVSPDALFGLDYRTGIGIAPDRLVAEESQIFGRGFLALKKNVFLYVEIVLPDVARDGAILDEIKTIPLGGEGRHATLRRVAPFSWPRVAPTKEQKPLVLLTTPCAFNAGWKPRGLDGRLVSAAVPDSLAYSGWDLARGGPKPTRFAAPAGSVYLLDSMPDEWAGTLAENEEDRRLGWGCCLKGVWTDE